MISVPAMPKIQLTPAWRLALWPFVAVLLALMLLFSPTLASMVTIWYRSETFTHAFVVPPITLWLVWQRRAELARVLPGPSPWVLPLLAGAALAWLLGDLVVANAVTQLAVTTMLVLTVPLMLGWSVTGVILFPLLFLFFMVPVGESLTPPLMQATADFTVLALRASGVPVYREGLQFVIPSGNWSVVEACSGIRYLMASFMVGSLFAYLNYRSMRRRAVFIAVSLVLPIVANWVRAYIIVMLGHLSNNRIATGVDHVLYGWVFFGIVIMAMFMIGARWAQPDAPAPQGPIPSVGGASGQGRAQGWWVAALAVALLVAPTWAGRHLASPSVPPAMSLVLPERLADDWLASAEPVTSWKPHFGEDSARAQQSYRQGDAAVGVFVAYYRNQTESRKLVSSTHVLVHSESHLWNPLRQSRFQLPLAGPKGQVMLPLHATELLSAAHLNPVQREQLLVWQLYWVGGQVTTSDVKAKLFSAWQRLSGQGDESASILIYTAQDEAGSAQARLERFVQANYGRLDAMLRGVAQGASSDAPRQSQP